jgi:hypothetical protein
VFEVDAASRLWTAGAVRTLARPRDDRAARRRKVARLRRRSKSRRRCCRTDLPEGRGGLSGHLVMGDTFFHPMFVNGAAHPGGRQRGVEQQARISAG